MRPPRFLAFVVASFAGFLLVISTQTQAQSNSTRNATITGTLTDPSGAAVSGAHVVAQPPDSSATAPASTESGPDGRFALTLPPGRYRVAIEDSSFEREEKEFTLSSGQKETWDVRMALTKQSSTVVVSATTAPIEADKSPYPVTVISHEDIEDRQEVWLAPMLMTGGGINLAHEGAFGGITTMFLDGGNSNYTKVLIDGASANQPGGDIDLEGFDVENLDKVEIVHGASSAER